MEAHDPFSDTAVGPAASNEPNGASRRRARAPIRILTFDDVSEVAADPPGAEGGQWNRHLFSLAAAGTPDLVADVIRFEPGFIHHMHRHSHADQVMVPLQGRMVILDETRTARELRVGQAMVIPRHNWHEARNVSGEDCVALHLFAGVGDISQIGFEAWPPESD
jgi:quercetin dioxygenase-like cupin family protein